MTPTGAVRFLSFTLNRRHTILPRYGPVAVTAAVLCLAFCNPVFAQLLPRDTGWLPQIGTPSVLPDTGTVAAPDVLRKEIDRLDAAPEKKEAPEQGWSFAPQISINQEWTDHILGTNKSSFVTAIQPGFLATGDISNFHSVVSYLPVGELFTQNGDENRLGHNFNADATAALIPEHLFLDLRGFGTVQSAIPGTGPSNTIILSKSNEIQTQSYSARPYLLEHFGDWVTIEAGGIVSYVAQNTLSTTGLQPDSIAAINQHATLGREYVSVASGPNLARISIKGLASAMQASGTGVLDGAYRREGDVELGYAITRSITALAGAGGEDIHYGGFPNYNFSGPQWDVGVRLVPNADSSITIRYGRKDGATSPRIDGVFAPSNRTRIYLRYSEGVTTDQELLQDALNASVLDPLGNPVDPRTGSPLLLVNNFYGVQTNLSLTKRGSITGTLLLDHDTISLSVGLEKNHQLSAPTPATAGFQDTTSVYGSINWVHEFVQRFTSSVYFQYGATNQVAFSPGVRGPTENPLIFSVGLNYPITTKLSTQLQYSYSRQPPTQAVPQDPSNLVIIGLKKTF
ncbi:MAG: TIGR03016 family PEP-CTERM system-associated outer membrane protein [Rhodopila sp.]